MYSNVRDSTKRSTVPVGQAMGGQGRPDGCKRTTFPPRVFSSVLPRLVFLRTLGGVHDSHDTGVGLRLIAWPESRWTIIRDCVRSGARTRIPRSGERHQAAF
jgi:hypothetical protein